MWYGLDRLEGQAFAGSSQALLDAHHHAPIAMQSTHFPPGQLLAFLYPSSAHGTFRGLTAHLDQASPKPFRFYHISLD